MEIINVFKFKNIFKNKMHTFENDIKNYNDLMDLYQYLCERNSSLGVRVFKHTIVEKRSVIFLSIFEDIVLYINFLFNSKGELISVIYINDLNRINIKINKNKEIDWIKTKVKRLPDNYHIIKDNLVNTFKLVNKNNSFEYNGYMCSYHKPVDFNKINEYKKKFTLDKDLYKQLNLSYKTIYDNNLSDGLYYVDYILEDGNKDKLFINKQTFLIHNSEIYK